MGNEDRIRRLTREALGPKREAVEVNPGSLAIKVVLALAALALAALLFQATDEVPRYVEGASPGVLAQPV
jgi:hypothetical protein